MLSNKIPATIQVGDSLLPPVSSPRASYTLFPFPPLVPTEQLLLSHIFCLHVDCLLRLSSHVEHQCKSFDLKSRVISLIQHLAAEEAHYGCSNSSQLRDHI